MPSASILPTGCAVQIKPGRLLVPDTLAIERQVLEQAQAEQQALQLGLLLLCTAAAWHLHRCTAGPTSSCLILCWLLFCSCNSVRCPLLLLLLLLPILHACSCSIIPQCLLRHAAPGAPAPAGC